MAPLELTAAEPMAEAPPRARPGARSVPRHLAIIMDGNARWAKRRRLPVLAGHKKGIERAREIVEKAANLGIKWITLFAFSSENWQRSPAEVKGLMQLFSQTLGSWAAELYQKGVKLEFIGDLGRLEKRLVKKMRELRQPEVVRLNLCVAVSYSGRWELARAARSIAAKAAVGELVPEAVDEKVLSRHLSLAKAPDPDLCIRTGGEYRISNFMLWQFAYSELYFSTSLWPDFDSAALAVALKDYGTRMRRFGPPPRRGLQVRFPDLGSRLAIALVLGGNSFICHL